MKVKQLVWLVAICLLGLVLALSYGQGEIQTGMSIRAVAEGSTDIDGDDIRYEFNWEIEYPDSSIEAMAEYNSVSPWISAPYAGTGESVIPAGIIAKGQIWRVRVRTQDTDLAYGPEVVAEVLVGGSPPTGADVYIEPVL